jgi:hypothetical protein
MARLSLWLFVIALGIDLGAGLYEARIVVPLWAGGIPATLAAGNPFGRVAIDAGIHFWAYVTSAVGLFAILALVFCLRAPAPQRTWTTLAAFLEIVAVAMTLLYFRPTLIRLFMGHGGGFSAEALATTVHRWVMLSRVRIAITFIAWLASLRAFSLS